jgi:hypothetical protein
MATTTQGRQPHHAVEPSPPIIVTILSFTISTIDIPKHPCLSSSLLPILSLCNHQPSSTFATFTNNLSPHSANLVETESSPPLPPPLQQVQEPLQQPENFPTHGTILTITGGSNIDIETKRQRRDYYRQVNHIAIEGPITQTKWSHMPITFSSQDINLILFPHTNAMVITVHIDRWDVAKILINNDSQAEILFLATFDQMGFERKQLKSHRSPFMASAGKELSRLEPSHSLCP